MTRLFIALLLLLSSSSFSQGKPFVINGSLPITAKKINVLLTWNNGNGYEEAKLINGKFTIKSLIEAPVFATLTLQEINPSAGKEFNSLEFDRSMLNLFIDTGKISVVSKTYLNDAIVKGSKVVNDYNKYRQQIKPLSAIESKLGEVFYDYKKQKNENAAKGIFSLYEKMLELYYAEDVLFVKNNPASLVSFYLTKKALGQEMNAAKAEPMFLLLDAAIQNSEQGKEVKEMIEIGKRSMVGVTAADFTQPDTSGKIISLSSLRGKYVLVDFWASWCGPCRAESPTLVKAYNKYKTKNFEILSVSLDENKGRWLKAIKDDGYTWPQVSDLKQANDAALLYGISSIPFSFLLDPNGVIVARNLRGAELEKKLESIFK
ncbi:MAG: redoxin domain-containing protein [Ferruginibacter sp.]